VTDLESEIGLFLGYGRGTNGGDPAWTSATSAVITSIRKSGERQFYFPPALEGTDSSYDWSFLRPVISLLLNSGATTVALPDDFGGFEGQAYISDTAGSSYWPVPLVSIGIVQELKAKVPSETGRPKFLALQPLRLSIGLGLAGNAGQRFQLVVFPQADAAYTLTFQYYVNPDALNSGTNPYVYGGMAHAETVLESCLAIAEQRLDDTEDVHTQKFMERLGASISHDRRNKPQLLGYNADKSDMKALRPGTARWWENSPVTFNQVQYP
jgi:hypothetical protein